MRVTDEKETIEITEARAVLEVLAAREAANMATGGNFARLRAIHEEMRPSVKTGDLRAYPDVNRGLVTLSGVPELG